MIENYGSPLSQSLKTTTDQTNDSEHVIGQVNLATKYIEGKLNFHLFLVGILICYLRKRVFLFYISRSRLHISLDHCKRTARKLYCMIRPTTFYGSESFYRKCIILVQCQC